MFSHGKLHLIKHTHMHMKDMRTERGLFGVRKRIKEGKEGAEESKGCPKHKYGVTHV